MSWPAGERPQDNGRSGALDGRPKPHLDAVYAKISAKSKRNPESRRVMTIAKNRRRKPECGAVAGAEMHIRAHANPCGPSAPKPGGPR